MEIKYQVGEPNNEDPLKSVIYKTGSIIKFTLQDIRAALQRGKKNITELDATVKVQKATMQNILDHYPEVGQMSEELLTAVYMYRHAMGAHTVAVDNLAEMNEAYREDQESLQAIYEQTGIALKPEIDEPIPVSRPIPPFDVQSRPVEGQDAN